MLEHVVAAQTLDLILRKAIICAAESRHAKEKKVTKKMRNCV